ncbi:phage integrase SAM-like domain-containing protein [Muribaculum intestinale]|uniref:phage integrase SAM-like domain-containing protein n=1 Tax=Muribaculum intestinale TaxID=1796646 RepID=UPI00339CA5F4
MSDSKRYTNREYFEFFQSRLSGLGAESMLKYRRTLSELDCFLIGHRLSLADLSETMTADWAVELLRQGLAESTVTRHLNIFSSLIKSAAKKGMMPMSDVPRTIAKLLAESKHDLPELLTESVFAHCLGILRDILKNPGSKGVCGDMLVFALLNGAMPLGAVAVLKKGDVVKYDEVSRSILERNQSPRREFVFDLKQSYRTVRQIHSAVTEGLKGLFGGQFAASGLDPDDLARSMWAACAMRCGSTASEASGCVGGAAPYAIPPFCAPAVNASENKQLWIRSVNSMLIHELPKWYAMHLRRGVRFDDLRSEISEKIRPVPELFYPCEAIRKHMGNRTIVEDRPFISQTAFFKCHPERVMPMFHVIGDRAWCYRTSNASDAPYAVIPQCDMRRFQAAVGVFTPDIEVHPLGELTPRPGESVIIVMAGYENREGEVEDIINKDCGSAIFRVKLSTDQGYEWRVDVDARQIERIINDL